MYTCLPTPGGSNGHTFHYDVRNRFVRGSPVSLKKSMVTLYRSEIIVVIAATKLASLNMMRKIQCQGQCLIIREKADVVTTMDSRTKTIIRIA